MSDTQKNIKEEGLSQTQMAQERTGLAFERTDLAHERTTLTNDQTLLAFIRTFIAVLAAGVGLFEFVDNKTIVTIGVIMMAISPLFVVVGVVNYFKVRKRISK